MSLERKDLRVKLDPDDHAALALLAEADDCDLAELAERILVRVVRRRVHAAMVIAQKAQRLGLAGRALPATSDSRERAGMTGNTPKRAPRNGGQHMQRMAQRSREEAQRTGSGWGTASLKLPGTLSTAAPGWMGGKTPKRKAGR